MDRCPLYELRIDKWSKTVKVGEGETFPVCDVCWKTDRSGLVLITGPRSVTGRCVECLEYVNPRELAGKLMLSRKVYRGVCVNCTG